MTDFEMRCCELQHEIDNLRNRLSDMAEERDELKLVVGDLEEVKQRCVSFLEALETHKFHLPMSMRFDMATLSVDLDTDADDYGPAAVPYTRTRY